VPTEEVSIVAQKARETFEKIREVRKTMQNKFKWQRDELEAKVKELQDEWWMEVKPLMKK